MADRTRAMSSLLSAALTVRNTYGTPNTAWASAIPARVPLIWIWMKNWNVPSANTTTGIASGASITAVTSASPRMCSRDRPIAAKPAATTDSTTATADTLSENTIACPQRGSANSAL